jgi:hypothetical protein
MPPTVDPDHDQRLEMLLEEFFEAFFRRFFPPGRTGSSSPTPRWSGRRR